MIDLKRLKELAIKSHYECEDGFYACPKSESYYSVSDTPKTECDCGADEHNAEVEKVFEELDKFVKDVADCANDCHQLCTDEGVPSTVWDVIEEAERMVKNES